MADDLMAEAMSQGMITNVTGVGCDPDCDHAHRAEPTGSYLDRFTWDGEQWLTD